MAQNNGLRMRPFCLAHAQNQRESFIPGPHRLPDLQDGQEGNIILGKSHARKDPGTG